MHNLIYEVVQNAIYEAQTSVDVALNSDGSVTVRDDGRGLPTKIHKGVAAVEIILSLREADARFERETYLKVGTPHSVGLAVVNALSSKLQLRIWREGKAHLIEFAHGETVSPLVVDGDANGQHGTEVTFFPSAQTFASVEFDFVTLKQRLCELAAHLNPGVSIALSDKRMTVE